MSSTSNGNDKIRLLQLITGLNVGGAEMLVHDLAKFASGDKFDVHVMSLIDVNDLLPRFHESKIYPVILSIRKNKFLSFFQGLWIGIKYVKTNKIQVIHAHMTHALLAACVFKLVSPGIKIVFTSHNIKIGSKFREFVVYLLRGFRDTDVVFSDLMLGLFYQKEKIVVIPNGIHTSRFKIDAVKNDVFTFIYVARFEYQKNHRFLITLVQRLKEVYHSSFQVLCVGKGTFYQDIEALVKAKKLASYIRLLGLRSDVPLLLAQSHVFIMPSLWEGFPIALLEAGAAGLPVIATPVGSIPKLVDESSGYVVDLEDFVDTMFHVLNSQQEAKIKGDHFRSKVCENYDIIKVVEMHEKIYKAV